MGHFIVTDKNPTISLSFPSLRNISQTSCLILAFCFETPQSSPLASVLPQFPSLVIAFWLLLDPTIFLSHHGTSISCHLYLCELLICWIIASLGHKSCPCQCLSSRVCIYVIIAPPSTARPVERNKNIQGSVTLCWVQSLLIEQV